MWGKQVKFRFMGNFIKKYGKEYGLMIIWPWKAILKVFLRSLAYELILLIHLNYLNYYNIKININ